MSTTTSPRTASATLHRLLDEELDFSPSFQEIYSSHLPMALVALEQMGATPDVLQATFDRHERYGEAERRDDWDALRVRLEEVASDGIEATVRRRVAALVDAPGTALFHPMIRLAYALDVGHEGQVAAALLDWERRRTPSGALPTRGDRRLADVAAELAAHPAGTWRRTFDLDGTARRPEMTAALAGVALDEHTLDDVVSFARAAHVAADDFVTLHLVTGARALKRVADLLDDDVADQLAFHALTITAIAYAAVGAAPLPAPDALEALRQSDWPSRWDIATRAVQNRDPHVIKLADVALTEEARTDDRLYRYLAARVVGLTD